MAQSIYPERFLEGNFDAWLRHFERCAAANEWDEATSLLKLPAFLQGPAATYFDSLSTAQRGTYAALVSNLKSCFAPSVDRELYYQQFEDTVLRPSEDPKLFLWRLKECLHNAEPSLSDTAFDALLRRQFMKAMPHDWKLKLLENDPTPTLDNMVQFAQRNRALQTFPTRHSAGIAACVHNISPAPAQLHSPSASSAAPTATPPPSGPNLSKVEELFTSVAEGQAALIAALSETTPKVRPAAGSRSRPPDTITCFRCRQPGHYARDCTSSSPRRRPARPGMPSSLQRPQCSLCFGWGHFAAECANNRNSSARTASYSQGRIISNNNNSLNSQGVPRF